MICSPPASSETPWQQGVPLGRRQVSESQTMGGRAEHSLLSGHGNVTCVEREPGQKAEVWGLCRETKRLTSEWS